MALKKRNGFKNITNLSEHIIFIPSTHLWAMGNFYFSNVIYNCFYGFC
jgi:hypothetical protein